jgi:cytochrome P450
MTTVYEFHRHADVRAALADPRLVPSPAPSGPVGGMAWLRATVARFSAGDDHRRRRALVEAELARLDPAALRATAALDGGADPRALTVRTLASAMGFAEPADAAPVSSQPNGPTSVDAIAAAVAVLAEAYFSDEPNPAADQAVAWLLPCLRPEREADPLLEIAANRIGLLVQAYAATGDLIEHARRAAASCPVGHSVESLLAETVRHDPPVRVMRRIATQDTEVAGVRITAGSLVLMDIAAANRDPDVFTDPETFHPERGESSGLTFGSVPRICPGREHALAIAAGALTAEAVAAADVIGRLAGGSAAAVVPERLS